MKGDLRAANGDPGRSDGLSAAREVSASIDVRDEPQVRGDAPTLPALPKAQVNALADMAKRNRVFEALFQVPEKPTRLGRYVLGGTLGQGGMGTVLKAIDPGLDRRVALKVLHHELDEQHTTRLRREAQALAKLSHPNVVQVYEVDEVDGQTFVAMELVKGQTLREWIKQDPRPSWQQCVEVYLQVGAGLAAAHEQGLVHRDFKPANAIIDDKGRVRVLDFGLARQIDDLDEEEESGELKTLAPESESAPLDTSLTRTGAVLGTPAYMPPEQMRGQEADGRSDQFSFCVSLYEAVYGERPFEGSSIAALLMSMDEDGIRAIPKGMKVPAKLRSVMLRGLASEPEQRWSSMESLLVELRGLVAPRRDPRWMLGLLGGVLVAGLGLWWFAPEKDSPRDEVLAAEPVQESGGAGESDASSSTLIGSAFLATAGGSTSDGEADSESGGFTKNGGTKGVESDIEKIGGAEAPPIPIQRPKPKRQQTDRSMRAKLKRKLRQCGDDGTIEINADLVLTDGRLLQERIKIRGPAENQLGVRECAKSHLEKFKLTRRKEASTFDPLVVKL